MGGDQTLALFIRQSPPCKMNWDGRHHHVLELAWQGGGCHLITTCPIDPEAHQNQSDIAGEQGRGSVEVSRESWLDHTSTASLAGESLTGQSQVASTNVKPHFML
ncbi:hypothetical protein RRG08_060181 [Elysia crispata]|uniref:Uncharacterized protein n=1 Tax=Elysia crispata TaxID=231223 RepID=A0AAE0ZZC8_9GAST|nr:hypothetical protein RRG08_060181 [Elysia crispata]